MNLQQVLDVARNTCGLSPDRPVVAGISGGPDSLCLLDVLSRLHFPVIAAHFDHGLRPESAQDAAVVQAAAEQAGVPFITAREDVGAFARKERLSVEAAARTLRYRFLFAQARRVSAQAVAVGHTADDQVETLLMHLLRGAGLAGLKGMAYRSILPTWDAEIPLVRPLLPFWRADTLAYCQERGLQPVFDASNDDIGFTRNRLRHELVPFLETYNPRFRQAAWRTAQLLAADDAVMQSALQDAWERCYPRREAQAVAMNREEFRRLAPGLQRGVLRRALAELLPALPDVDFAAIERGLRWVESPGSGHVDLVQGLVLKVEGEQIWVAAGKDLPVCAEWPQLAVTEIALPVPGIVEIGAGWWLESANVGSESIPPFLDSPVMLWEAWLDADTIDCALRVRQTQAGDRFQPFGLDGTIKLSDFWINAKLPRRARAAWPLVVAGDAILWVPGFRIAHSYRVQADTRRALHLRLARLDASD